LLAALGAATLAPDTALADPARVPFAKAFKYLDMYYALPAQLKSKWYLMFVVKRGDRPAPEVRPTLVLADGARTPLQIDAAGEVLNAPSSATLRGSGYVEIDPSARLISEIRPTIAPATRLDALALEQALAQVSAAVAHIAGAFGALAPRLDVALFPDAGSGQAITGDGRAWTLPMASVRALGAVPYFQPTGHDGVRTLELARAPSRILLAVKPRS